MARHCTIPAIFGLRHWWEVNFGEACEEHDRNYTNQHVTRKRADNEYFAYMVNKGYPILGVAAYAFIRLFGWLYWYDIIGGSNTK